MLAREARVALEAFAEAVLAAQALLVAAVGALGSYEGEEYQIAHLCRRVPVPSQAALSHRMRPRRARQLSSLGLRRPPDGTPRESGGPCEGQQASWPFTAAQSPLGMSAGFYPSVLQAASQIMLCAFCLDFEQKS